MPLDQTLRDQLLDIVGAKALISDAAGMEPYLREERGNYHGRAALVVRPGSTREVARIVAACAAAGVPIVPQGGNTGLCGGAVATDGVNEIVMNLGRMNSIRAIDPVNFTIALDAGCILADVQKAADGKNCLFPLSLAAEGSCQIGGNLSTNAGGINVLRYGNARDLVLGLEVVLPDGRTWNGMRALGKDNTGYALRHLFVGAEGTLGIITGAVLKLFPKPLEKATAFCGFDKIENATVLLNRARALSGDAVTAFELMPRIGIEFCLAHVPGNVDPLSAPHPWYVLMELSSSRPNSGVRAAFEQILESAFEDGIIADAVVAESQSQANALWRLRETLPEAQKPEGGSIKHDVSVPVSSVPALLTEGMAAVTERFPGTRPVPFGHLGDGNIHFNITQPKGADTKAYLGLREEVNRIIHDIVVRMGGSISAEHGIGLLKVDEMVHYKDPVELELMRRLKHAFDPANLMNPGKIVR